MPQSSDELRDVMTKRFGSIDTHGPEAFLKRAGYSLSPGWEWSKSGVTDLKQMTQEEWECLLYLVEEWDYGGLRA